MFRCSGSLVIVHHNGLGQGTSTDLAQLRLHKGKYRNLHQKGLNRTREINKVQSEGNCCWKIWSDVMFTGREQTIQNGFDGQPNFRLKSVEIINC